jgi:hypothetical protein
MDSETLSQTKPPPVIEADGTNIIVQTGDGRTGDRCEFHMSGSLIHATLDRTHSTVSVWATEAALPDGTFGPSVGVESRFFRLQMSRTQAERLRDALTAEFKQHRRQKLTSS